MANEHKVEIVVGIKDLATRSIDNLINKVSQLSKLSSSNIGTGFSAFNRNLDSTISKMDKLANSLYKFKMYTSDISRNLRNITSLGVVMGGALAIDSANAAIDYQYKMATAQSRMEVSNNVKQQVSDYILNNLNNQVAAGPSKLADLAITLGQGGISNANDMKSLLKTVSYFSEAVDAVPDQAAEMVISAAKGFNIPMQKSSDITDKLTVALNKSLLQVDEMPHAIGELSGRAKMYGQSLDSSLVALMTGRNQGMSAAQMSQDFLNGLRSISLVGNDMVLYPQRRKYYESLGVDTSFFDTNTKKLKEYPEIIASLEKTLVNNGFTNKKYGVENIDDFHKLIQKYNGQLPEDFWNSMKAMPLISRVFGAAGMAPIMMGLQSTYQETDPKTGKATGPVYYGSEALKKMEYDVQHSKGAVNDTHDIVANTAKFQLDVLKGVWESGQIKLMDNFLPLIQTTSDLLGDWIGGKNSKPKKPNGQPQTVDELLTGSSKFQLSVDDTAENLKKSGHPILASLVKTTGNGITNAVNMSPIVNPLSKDITGAFSDLTKADWGNSLLTFPAHAVKNITKFILDIANGSKDLDDAISKLPENLQDPAKLITKLVQGGLILLATNSMVKILELTIRGASTALKTYKIGKDITTAIADFIVKLVKGGTKGDGKGKGLLDTVLKDAVKTMNVEAAVVNVYGGKKPDGTPQIGDGKNGKSPNNSGKVSPPKINAMSVLKGGALAFGAYAGYELTQQPWQKWQDDPNNKYKAILGKVPANYKNYTNDKEEKKQIAEEAAKEANKVTNNYTQKELQGIKKYVQDIKKSTPTETAEKTSASVKKTVIQQLPKSLQDKQSALHDKQMYNMLYNNVDTKTNNIQSSIVSGFNQANKKLQNVKLNNNVNVNVSPPQVSITGDIGKYLTVSSKGSTKSTSSNKVERYSQEYFDNLHNSLLQRRLSW